MTNDEIKRESARRTRRSFLIAGVGAFGGYGFYRYLQVAPGDQMLPRPLRKVLDLNAQLSRAVFREHALAPTYPLARAVDLRINGNYGLKQQLLLESYRLQVVGVDGAEHRPGYVKDVTAWDYKYAVAPTKYEGHDTKVDPAKEKTLAENYRKVFRPAMMRQPGFVEVQLMMLREAKAGKAPEGMNYRLLISFKTEEDRLNWVKSADHQAAWPTMQATFQSKSFTAVLFDVI